MASAKTRKPLPSFDRVRELFDYDQPTGKLTWRIARGSRGIVGAEAGSISDGNRRNVCVDGTHCKVHRIIWLWMTGKYPPDQIDHRDGNASNNKWENLRLANNSLNMANRGKQSNNSTGLKGAYRNNGSWWMSRISKDGVDHYLGAFPTAEEAHAAYIKKAKELFGDFARAA